MLLSCIKYFFIIYCGFYLYRKLLNQKTQQKLIVIQCISSVVLSLLTYYIRLFIAPSSILILMIIYTIINYLLYKQSVNITIVSSLISMCFSYALLLLSLILFMPVFYLIFHLIENRTAIYSISYVFVCLMQLLLASIPFRFNRLKHGMPFLKTQGKNDIGVFISISLLLITPLFNLIEKTPSQLFIPTFFIALSGILIFFWWKHKLTETYLTKVKDREIAALKDEITKLKEYNATIDKAMHKDNKLIPNLIFEVENALAIVASHASEEDRKLLLTALERVQSSARERKGILQLSIQEADVSITSGSHNIDSTLRFLATKAYAEQTFFEVIITDKVHNIIPEIISEEDFRTLITDLIENAIIAVRSETNRNILFHTRMEADRFYVDIYDSGAPFAPEVLEKLGREQITTHKDTGGSGIGYMSIFEILHRCKGSLTIDENLDMGKYTKRVSISFPLMEQ